jgi:hypothetical protein
MAIFSQVQSKVEAKPNIARLPKLRCGSSDQQGQGEETWQTDSDNLLEVEDTHLALVVFGAHPFFVHDCEAYKK